MLFNPPHAKLIIQTEFVVAIHKTCGEFDCFFTLLFIWLFKSSYFTHVEEKINMFVNIDIVKCVAKLYFDF